MVVFRIRNRQSGKSNSRGKRGEEVFVEDAGFFNADLYIVIVLKMLVFSTRICIL